MIKYAGSTQTRDCQSGPATAPDGEVNPLWLLCDCGRQGRSQKDAGARETCRRRRSRYSLDWRPIRTLAKTDRDSPFAEVRLTEAAESTKSIQLGTGVTAPNSATQSGNVCPGIRRALILLPAEDLPRSRRGEAINESPWRYPWPATAERVARDRGLTAHGRPRVVVRELAADLAASRSGNTRCRKRRMPAKSRSNFFDAGCFQIRICLLGMRHCGFSCEKTPPRFHSAEGLWMKVRSRGRRLSFWYRTLWPPLPSL